MALARPRLLFALLVVYMPFFVIYFASPIAFSLPHAAGACRGQPVLDQRWGYSAEQVADYLHGCGATGRAAITAQQDADLVYPALFGAVLTVALALLLRALLPERHWAHALVLHPRSARWRTIWRTSGPAPSWSPIPSSRRSSRR